MATRKAEVLFIGDAASIVRAAKQAEVASAKTAAAAKKGADETVAANERVAGATEGSVARQVRAHKRSTASLASVGSAFSKLTLPIVGVAAVSAKFAMDFQADMERVHTQAGVSQRGVEQLSKAVLHMSGQVAQAPLALADGMYHVASSLNSTLPAATRYATEIKVLKTAAEGATVGHANLVDVANALDAAVVSGMKGVQNYSKAMGTLNAVVGAGDMTMQDLADALSTGVLGPMKTYGMTLKDVGGALAVFGDNNIRGQDAATKLISAVRIMAAPSKAAAKELGGIGLSTLQLAGDIRTGGLVKALTDLKTHLKNSGDTASEQGLVIARAFGGKQSTGVQLLLGQLDRLKSKTQEVGAGAQNFGNAWAATQKTAAFQVQSSIDTIKANLTQLGVTILPTLLKVGTSVARDVNSVASAFTSLPSDAQQSIIKGGLVLAGIGPAMKLLGLFTGGVSQLYKVGQLAARLMAGQGLASFKSSVPGAAVPVAAAESTMVGSLRSGMSGVLARGLQMTAIAGIGTLAAQAIGTAIHGSAGEAVKVIGTDTAIGASLGSIFGPAGIAGGAIVGGLVGSVTHFLVHNADGEGRMFADKFTSDLPGRISTRVREGLAKSTQRLTNLPLPGSSQANNQSGDPALSLNHTGATINTALFQKQFQKDFATLFNASFTAGKKAGDAFVTGWQGVKFPTEMLMLRSLDAKLNQVPDAIRAKGPQWVMVWQDAAAKQMIGYATKLEEQGKLPKGAVDKMILNLETSFPTLTSYLVKSGQQTENVIAKTMNLTQAQVNWRNALANFRNEWGDTAVSQHLTTDNIVKNTHQAMSDLEGLIRNSSGKQRKSLVSELDTMKAAVKSTFSSMVSDVAAKQAAMTKSIASGSKSAAQQAGTNLYGYEQNVYQAMAQGLLTSNQGAKLITIALDATLKAFGSKQIPMPTAVSGMSAPGKGLHGGTNAAGGALVQFGNAGARGHDNIPVNFGGVPVMVGSGEVGAVFNHQQQSAFAGMYPGGLKGFFGASRGLHHMASGGIPAMMSEANLINSKHYPYVWGGGHNASFSGPYDCSGSVSAVLHAAGLLNSPEVSGQLMNYGLPGPGAVTVYANPKHTFMSIMGKFFGTHGSSGAGWYAGSALPGFAVRHAPVNGAGSIGVPNVTGTGTISTMVRGALKKMTGAANSKVAKAFASSIMGGGGGGGDWGTFGPVSTQVFDFFSGNGFDKMAIAGILGNASQESGGNPNTPGGGMWQQISNFGSGTGGSLLSQMRTMLPQILGLRGAMNAASSPGAAATIFEQGFERAGIPAMSNRIAAANAAYAAGFGGGGMLPYVGSFRRGGTVPADGMAHVHRNETIIPPYGTGGIAAGSASLSSIASGLLASAAANPSPGATVARALSSGFLFPLAAAIQALTDLAAKAKNPIKINLEIKNLTQLKAFRDAIAGLRDQVKGLTASAAQAWRTLQEAGINKAHDAAVKAATGVHDAAVTAIGNSPAAVFLAAMQSQDATAATAAQLSGLNKNLTDAQFLAAHSGGQTHLDALQQVKDAQAAIDAFNRQQTEQQLQDSITADTKKADDALAAATKSADDQQTVALAGLDKQQADYQKFLDGQLGALTNSLAKRTITYAAWAKDVDAVLAQYGLSASTDAGTEITLTLGPPKKGKGAKKSPRAHIARAGGGPVLPGYVYRVGEQGAEDVVFGRPGVVMTAAQSRRGGTVHIEKAYFTGTSAARAFADRLAFRAAIGTA